LGTPLDSVVIVVDVDRPGFGYLPVRATTNGNGEFTYEVQRLTAPVSVPQPDTVNARVTAVSVRPRDVVNGQAPVSSASALVSFVPKGQTPKSTAVQITLHR